MTLKTTYKDNAWLDDDYKRTLEGYKDSDPYYYQVYCLGQWGVIGKTIFDAAKVNGRLAELRDPVKRGYFAYSTRFDAVSNQVRIDDRSIKWVDDDDGYISIYQDRREGVPYVIGGDTSGEGSDWFVGQVLDNTNGRQVCTLRHQFDEDVYAAQMYCLGIYYNKALIAIEANYSSYPIKELQRLRYPRQYVRQTEDNYTHRPRDSYRLVLTMRKARPTPRKRQQQRLYRRTLIAMNSMRLLCLRWVTRDLTAFTVAAASCRKITV